MKDGLEGMEGRKIVFEEKQDRSGAARKFCLGKM
jgi:hypothetical protein